MNSVDPRDRADWQAHHPAPAEWANSRIKQPRDHRRTRIVWLIAAGFTAFAIWGVVLWLCSGVGAV